MSTEKLSSQKFFEGEWRRYRHMSAAVGTPMEFSVFLPQQALDGTTPVPALLWLSGLTCTDKNFMEKAGAQRVAAKFGFALLAPDTSPRGAGVEGESASWDFGVGAGFYLDATTDAYKTNYRMHTYVTEEFPAVVASVCPNIDLSKVAISGHSMGGHGAISLFFRNPGKYVSVSAFAPISNPINCPWGKKAFTGYLGEDHAAWASHDSSRLIAAYRGEPVAVLVSQGLADQFLEEQLKPHTLLAAAKEGGDVVTVDLQEAAGYDHSYCFVATFFEQHAAFHAARLGL